jgi:hypothetical protein
VRWATKTIKFSVHRATNVKPAARPHAYWFCNLTKSRSTLPATGITVLPCLLMLKHTSPCNHQQLSISYYRLDTISSSFHNGSDIRTRCTTSHLLQNKMFKYCHSIREWTEYMLSARVLDQMNSISQVSKMHNYYKFMKIRNAAVPT